MEKIKITGGNSLFGTTEILPAKNSVLPIIASVFLTQGEVKIKNCPHLSDVESMLKIIRSVGGTAEWDGKDLVLSSKYANPTEVDEELTGRIRSSFFILGPILSRFSKARVSYPGGCEIGIRPIDIHLCGLKKLGVKIIDCCGVVECDGSNMHCADITLDFPSVGATENLMMASVLLDGTTILRSVAREPEIIDLANFINKMGGRIYGAGGDTIVIEGVKSLHGCEYTPIPDRIVGGTLLVATAIAGGDITLNNFSPTNIYSVLEKLVASGCEITSTENSVRIISNRELVALPKVETMPFPGFPTDMQAQFVAMLTTAHGSSLMVENLFESRYRYTAQLCKMGAKITVKDRVAVIKGVKRLHSAVVKAEDLRGGASLILAALGAEGESTITDIYHIDRGYYRIEEQLASLGANIKREYYNKEG